MSKNRDNKWMLQNLENNPDFENIHEISGGPLKDVITSDVFESYKKVWQLTANETVPSDHFDVDAAWNKVEAKLDSDSSLTTIYKVAPQRYLSFALNFMKVAAILLIGLAIFRISMPENPATFISSGNQNNLETRLPDGTIACLNNNSHINYPEKFGNSLREIYFWGEAYFEVAHEKSRPFIIHTGDARIKVLGTSFNVKSIPGSSIVEVTVKEGKVLLYCVNEQDNILSEIVLSRGETGRLNSLNHVASKVTNEDLNYLTWKTGVLKFVDTPLTKVLNDVSKNYHVQLSYNPEELAGLKLTADFENEDIDAVIEVISLVHHLKFTANGKGFLVTKTG